MKNRDAHHRRVLQAMVDTSEVETCNIVRLTQSLQAMRHNVPMLTSRYVQLSGAVWLYVTAHKNEIKNADRLLRCSGALHRAHCALVESYVCEEESTREHDLRANAMSMAMAVAHLTAEVEFGGRV